MSVFCEMKMDRRDFLKTIGIAAATMVPGCRTSKNTFSAKGSKPNILFIFSDDHGQNTISAYGSKVNKTPNIDRIAKQGAIFNNSFCTNSICQPSRASVMTGKHSHLNGVTYNGARWDGSQTIFPRLLKQAGYQTSLVGKWHLTPNPTTEFDYWKVLQGFGGQGAYYHPTFATAEETEQITGYSTDLITDEAIDWLENKRQDDKPFLLMTQFKSPHVPRRPPLRYLDKYADVEIPEPETLYDDYSGRERYSSEAYVHVSDLNEEILGIFPPKGSGIAPNRWQKKWFARLSPEEMEAFHKAYDKRNAEYYEMKRLGKLKDHKDRTKYGYQRYMKEYLACLDAIDDNVGRLLDYLQEKGLAENTVVIYCSDQSYFTGEHGWYEKRWMYEESLRMPFVISWPKAVDPGLKIDHLIQNMDYAPTFLEMAGVQPPSEMQGRSLLTLLTEGNDPTWRDSIYYHYYEHGGHNVPRHDGIRTERYKLICYYTDDLYEMYDLLEDPNELKNIANLPAAADKKQMLIEKLARLREEYKVPPHVFRHPYKL